MKIACLVLFVTFELLGKNAYAMSILRRVEMKLDGRDIANNRYLLAMDLLLSI